MPKRRVSRSSLWLKTPGGVWLASPLPAPSDAVTRISAANSKQFTSYKSTSARESVDAWYERSSESSGPGQKPVLVDQPVVPEMIRCIKCDNLPERVRPASCVGDGHVGSQYLNAFVHHTLQHLLGLPLQALKRHLGTNEKRFYPLHHLVQTLRVSPAEHLHHGRQPSPAPTPSPVFDPVGKGVHLALRRPNTPQPFGRDALRPQAEAVIHHRLRHVLQVLKQRPTTLPLLWVGQLCARLRQLGHEGGSRHVFFPGLSELLHHRAAMAEDLPQLSHQVKRVDLIDRLRKVLHASAHPLRPVAVDDHHGVLVDIIQRVHEPARQLPKILGLGAEVTLVHQHILVAGRVTTLPAFM